MDLAKGHLELLLLGVVADGPRHGYAVISDLRERTDGAFELTEGTVYPALHRLQDAGQLASDWEEVGGRRRRIYRITDAGRSALVTETRRWQGFAAAVDAVLGPRSSAAMAPLIRPRPSASLAALLRRCTLVAPALGWGR